jgi:hypothetical protein
MELESIPRLDIKSDMYADSIVHDKETKELYWKLTRIIRTPYSELYALYLEEESAGEIHVHIGHDINATIITTLDISDNEKAELMGFVHEMLLEALEEEYSTKSTISFFSEAEEYI